ncbi:methyl-accepting chemotaxis protein [Erythrobacter sp. W53]|uniref:methyl-accepting chemotaxis protein n=1 Tax=Erythrobacter sp. W53 TaxID=3425947 RepID=UPI003D76A1AE
MTKVWDMLGGAARWMMRGSISSQMDRIFAMLIAIFAIFGLVAAIGLVRVEQRAAALSELTNVAFVTASMNQSVAAAKDNMGAYRARNYDPALIALSIESARRASTLNEQLRSSVALAAPNYLPTVDALNTQLAGVELSLIEVRDASLDIVEEESFLGPKYDQIDAAIANIVTIREDVATRVEETSGRARGWIQTLIGAMVALMLVAVGVIFFGKRLVARQIVQPIEEISEISERIAAGETELDIPGAYRNDEIGTMANALTILREKQEETASTMRSELDIQRERAGKIDLLQGIAETFEKTIGDVANEIASASNQMHSAAGQLAGSADQTSGHMAKASEELRDASATITGAAAASDEFAMSIREISQQAASSAMRARNASEAASEVDGTISTMTGSADKISEVVEMISQIAQRTNLLALNASIEAARGGEAGRGFAVVASEVKELAAETGKATQEVEQLINDMQSATNTSAEALRTVAQEVVELEQTSVAIAAAVDQQSISGDDLAQSIGLVAGGTENVSANIDDVSEMSDSVGKTAGQVLESSTHLQTQSERLRSHVADFLKNVRAA